MFIHIYISIVNVKIFARAKYFNSSITKINGCVVHSWKNYMYRNNLTIYSPLDNDVIKTTSENNAFRLLAILQGKLEVFRILQKKEYNVLFKYIRCSLKLTHRYAVYYRFSSKLELHFWACVFIGGNLRSISKWTLPVKKEYPPYFFFSPSIPTTPK